MEIGKVPENVLKRSVMKKIKHRRPEVLMGASVGEDCAALTIAEDEMLVMSTDPITGTRDDIGTLAVQITMNDLASAGAEPIGIMSTILLPPETREIVLKTIMTQLADAAAAVGIEIIGGHTEVTPVVNQPLISITGVGKAKKGAFVSTGGARPGMDLVLTKWIGLEGTSIIAKARKDALAERLPEKLISQAANFDQYLSVLPEARIAVDHKVAAMHDVTEGGIFGALWEICEAGGTGCQVDLKKIPIRQETVEICEFFDINPYKLISSGSMLMAAEDGESLAAALQEHEIPASVIGKVTAGNDRLILRDEESRFLEPPKTDELYQVI